MLAIRRLRKRLGLTQAEIAKQIGVTAPTFSRWETGMFFPRVDKLLLLAQVLHCTIAELMETEEK
ncbi:MAG: helix-turn-helix transcriptional regulator [Acidaminococcaceae bacterium]